MTKLDSIFKSRDITLPTKFRLVKAMVFPRVWPSNLSGQKNHMVILHSYRYGVFKAKQSDSVGLSGPGKKSAV